MRYSKYSDWDLQKSVLFRLWCRIFVEIVMYLLDEDVMY